jgi:hypothetical protein
VEPIAIDKVHRRLTERSMSYDGAEFIRPQHLSRLASENPLHAPGVPRLGPPRPPALAPLWRKGEAHA